MVAVATTPGPEPVTTVILPARFSIIQEAEPGDRSALMVRVTSANAGAGAAARATAATTKSASDRADRRMGSSRDRYGRLWYAPPPCRVPPIRSAGRPPRGRALAGWPDALHPGQREPEGGVGTAPPAAYVPGGRPR